MELNKELLLLKHLLGNLQLDTECKKKKSLKKAEQGGKKESRGYGEPNANKAI